MGMKKPKQISIYKLCEEVDRLSAKNFSPDEQVRIIETKTDYENICTLSGLAMRVMCEWSEIEQHIRFAKLDASLKRSEEMLDDAKGRLSRMEKVVGSAKRSGEQGKRRLSLVESKKAKGNVGLSA